MDSSTALVIAGILLIAAEFCLPGWVWPGVLGGVGAIYGAYQLPAAPILELLASTALAVAAARLGWPTGTVGVAGVAAVASVWQMDVHWMTAISASLPAIVLHWLMTVAMKASANKTIVG